MMRSFHTPQTSSPYSNRQSWRSQSSASSSRDSSNDRASPMGTSNLLRQPSPLRDLWQWLKTEDEDRKLAAASPKARAVMAAASNGNLQDYDKTFRLSSPEPTPTSASSIDNFLNQFSTSESFFPLGTSAETPTAPEPRGQRPESPEGKARSRPMTPTLDHDFDYRSLNITPEPVFSQPGAGSFDNPPPYSADWGINSYPVARKPAQASLSSQQQAGLLPWYNDVSGNISGNRSSFHSLDELQPPSYPSAAAETPPRHTWAGDSKDESIWNRFVANPEDEEAAEYLRQVEQDNLVVMKKQRMRVNSSAPSTKPREKVLRTQRRFTDLRRAEFGPSGDDCEPTSPRTPISPLELHSPSFDTPRRDTGAWWLQGGRANNKKDFANDGPARSNQAQQPIEAEPLLDVVLSDSQASSSSSKPDVVGSVPPSRATASASIQHIEGVMSFIDHTPAAAEERSEVILDAATNSSTQESSASDHQTGICGLCNADLRYQEGEATEVWYLRLKNHFDVAHGNWANRMLDFYGPTNPPVTEPQPEKHQDDSKSDSDALPETKAEDKVEPEKPTEEPKVKEHECPVTGCTESFDVLHDLSSHINDKHGSKGSALPITRPRSPREFFAQFGGFKKRSMDHECIAFRCSKWFSTEEERDLHMEVEHGIGRSNYVSDAGFSDKLLLDEMPIEQELWTEVDGKLTDLADVPVDLEEFAKSNSAVVAEETKSTEFGQLWQGFSNAIKMNEDVQPSTSSTDVKGHPALYDENLSSLSYKPKNLLAEEDKMFNQTLSELLKVVRETSETPSMLPHDDAFDVQAWLQGHLDTIGPEAAQLLISSSPTYYENIAVEPDAAEWVQKIRNGLDSMKPKKSRKGKERAVEYETQGETSATACDNTTRNPQLEEISRIKLAAVNTRFLTAANNAYEKLIAGTKRSNASKEFVDFVASLGGVDDIINVGMDVVDQILCKDVPRSLSKVYCFLHVAYAISQCESSNPEKSNDFEFRAGLSVLRHCLPAISGMPSERDIFDEIVNVMWDEFEYAVKWIEKWDGNEALHQVGGKVNEVEGLKMFMRNHCTSEPEEMPSTMTIDPKLLSLGDDVEELPVASASEKLSTWENLIGCGIFAIVARFLKDLKETGLIFAYLCGGICSTLASGAKKRIKFKDRISTIPESSKSAQLETHLQQDVVLSLNGYKYSGVENITNSAISMLRQGYINTIREFENCMISLTRVRRRTESEFSSVVHSIVWHCNSCATFVPDNLWDSCKGEGDEDYSLSYVDEKVEKELRWFTGKSVEKKTIVDQLPSFDGEAMEIDPAVIQPVNIGMCAIDTLLIPSPHRRFSQGSSPANTTASTDSPNSLWENSPRGHQGSETSYSNPNSNNVTPDEVYVNPNMPRENTDYFSYYRPQPIVEEQPREVAAPTKSRKRKYLEGDGASSFPARRRKMAGGGKRLYCDVAGCEEFASTSSNLSRHKRTKHGNAAVREASYHCESKGCDRVFYGPRGKGNLRTHMRKDHGDC